MTKALPLLAFGLFACSPGGTFQGKLTDGMTGDARGELRVLAKSESSDLTCQVREATTGADGTFLLENLCSSDTYTLTLSDETLFVPDMPSVSGAEESAGVVDLKAWRAPTAPGLYRLEGEDLKRIRTFSDVESIQTEDEALTVRYPASKPVKLAGSQKISAGSYLVLSDASIIEKMEVFPLVSDPDKRGFAGGTTIEDHVWIGVKFASNSEYEEQKSTFDAAKVTDVGNADRKLQYVSSDALESGRYAVLGKDDKQTFILDFGTGPAEPAPEGDGEG